MQIKLPLTSPEHYLTGKTALNIPSPEGTGDWHFSDTFEGYAGRTPTAFVVAGIDTIDTTKTLGSIGIFDCYERLSARGLKLAPGPIYAADHYRAIADIVLNALARNWEFGRAVVLDDWLPERSEKQQLFALLERARPALINDHWNKIAAWATNQLQ